MKEDDWECEACGAKNQWVVGDLTTARCKKCKTKNEIIEDMLYVMGNRTEQLLEERAYDDVKNPQRWRAQ